MSPLVGLFFCLNIYVNFRMFFEKYKPFSSSIPGVNHRHQHSIVRDIGERKPGNAQTIPDYLKQDHSLPDAYKVLKRNNGAKIVKISPKDASVLMARFGVRNLKPGKPKGLKKTGISILYNGNYYLQKTRETNQNSHLDSNGY